MVHQVFSTLKEKRRFNFYYSYFSNDQRRFNNKFLIHSSTSCSARATTQSSILTDLRNFEHSDYLQYQSLTPWYTYLDKYRRHVTAISGNKSLIKHLKVNWKRLTKISKGGLSSCLAWHDREMTLYDLSSPPPTHTKLNNYLEHHYNVEGIESRLFVQNIEAGILSMIKDRIDLGFD